MAGVNIGNQGLTYINYLDDVVDTLNQSSKARTMTRNDYKWTGEHIEGRVHVKRNSAIKYMEDGGAFPVAKKQTYTPYKATRKFVGGSIQLTDGAMATASGGKNVAKDVIQSEVKGLMRDMLKFENFHFFRNGDGSVGALDDTGLQSAATDVSVTDARGLWEDGEYEVYDSTLTTNRGTVVVSDVEEALSSGVPLVNFDTTVANAVSGDLLVRKGSVNRAITGLDKLIANSGTFQTINTATYPKYTSAVLSNSGTNRPLTPTLFRQTLAAIKQKSGNDRPAQGLSVLCSNWQAIEVEELYESELRLTPSDTSGGAAVASFNSAFGKINVITDADAPYNKMFFVDFSKIYRAVQKKLSWRRGKGGKIFERNDNSMVWTATALEICELFIKERNTCAKITDLSETLASPF